MFSHVTSLVTGLNSFPKILQLLITLYCILYYLNLSFILLLFFPV